MKKVLYLSRDETIKAVRGGEITICVVGLGFVGLPLAILFSTEGARVIGCVRTEKSAEKINRGETRVTEHDVSPLLREGASMLVTSCPNCGVRLFKLGVEAFCPSCGRSADVTEFGIHLQDKITSAHERIVNSRQSLEGMLKESLRSGKFHASIHTAEAVRDSTVTLITVGTPTDEKHSPDYSDLEKAGHDVGRGLQKGMLVVLKSTVSIGITENLLKPILEAESKLKAGVDFGLAFMPETIKEGHAIFEFRTLPRIVGGVTKRCAEAAANVFSVFPAPVAIYEKTSIVEAAKLFMNIYRDVNIALANDLALACENLEVDVVRAINAANFDPKTHLLTPGLVGGYCLPKDAYYLTFPSEKAGHSPRLIILARHLNDRMPLHIVELVEKVFEEMNMPLKAAKIAFLGLGFKANSGDLRNTPAVPIIRDLFKRGASVVAQDPLAHFDEANQILPGLVCERGIEEAVHGASCTVIAADHIEYRGLTSSYLKGLMSRPCAVVDARHIIDAEEARAAGIVFRGLGKPKQ